MEYLSCGAHPITHHTFHVMPLTKSHSILFKIAISNLNFQLLCEISKATRVGLIK